MNPIRSIPSAALLLVCSAGFAQQCTIQFQGPILGPQDYPGEPRLVRAADINRDGISDLITVCADYAQGKTNIDVRLGRAGSYDPPIISRIHDSPSLDESWALADLDGDGWEDVASRSARGFNVAYGAGDGSFRRAGGEDTGQSYRGLAAGDLDGNGTIDIVLTRPDDNKYLVYMGAGRQYIELPPGSTIDAVQPQIADFDLDGNPDLIARDSNGTYIVTHRGHRDGTFGEATVLLSLPSLAAIHVADCTDDGFPDLVIASKTGGIPHAGIAVNNGNNTVRHPALTAIVGADGSMTPTHITTLDPTGDTREDVAIVLASGAYTRRVAFARGDGDGALEPGLIFGDPFEGYEARSLSIGDADNDGRIDIIVPHWFGVAYYQNTTSGGVEMIAITPPQLAQRGQTVVLEAAAYGWDLEFQWYRNFVRLVDGNGVRGSATSCLEIDGVDESDTGTYECRAIAACGRESLWTSLIVRCPGDFNEDGALNLFDFLAFQTAFGNGC